MTNKIVIAWPVGSDPYGRTGQQLIWSWLSVRGMAEHCQFAHQINANQHSPDFPHNLTGPLNIAHTAERQKSRDWYPHEPEYEYWDCEPPNWIWRVHRDGPSELDVAVSHQARAELRAWNTERGLARKSGIYGLPVSLGSHPSAFTADQGARWAATRKMIDPWDWVYLALYPPSRLVPEDWMKDEATHAHRAAGGFRAAQALYRQPTIPFLWPRWGMDTERYAQVYIDALMDAGCTTLGLWINPHTKGMTNVYRDALNKFLPSLRRFVGVK